MISHQHKCVFIHIPKNAGQSIERVFLDLLGLTWKTRGPLLLRANQDPERGPRYLAHLKAEEYLQYNYLTPELFKSYFKFSFVRNPWSRMVSVYKYFGYSNKCDFRTFLLGDFKHEIYQKQYYFVGPQSEFIINKDGELLVDYVGRFENLQNDFQRVCEKLNIAPQPVPHINQSNKTKITRHLKNPKTALKTLIKRPPKNNFPGFKRFQDYYDQECIDFVAEVYKSDIDFFGYDFGSNEITAGVQNG